MQYPTGSYRLRQAYPLWNANDQELDQKIADHKNAKNNPHQVTAAQVGAETPAGAQAKANAVQANLDAHKADTVVHVTEAEHTKLSGIEAGAEVNQNAFASINGIAAANPSDELTIEGGTGIVVTQNPTTKKVILTATGEAIPGAHGSSHDPDGADPIPALDQVIDDVSGLAGAGRTTETVKGNADDIAAVAADLAAQKADYVEFARLINGDFSVWQFGTSRLNMVTIDYLADRWMNVIQADGATMPDVTTSRQELPAGDPQGLKYCYRVSFSGAGSGLGNLTRHNILQFVEGATQAYAGAGKKVTLSLYARSNIPGKRIGTNLHQSYGTGGSPYENIYGTNWELTPEWKRYTFTWETNSLEGKTIMRDNCMAFQIWWVWGDGYKVRFGSDTAEGYGGAGYIEIKGVQFDPGDKVQPYRRISYQDQLRAAKRFCEKSYDAEFPPGSITPNGSFGVMASDNINNKFVYSTVRFSEEKLNPPTIMLFDTAGNYNKITTRDASDNPTHNVTPSIGPVDIGATGFKVKHQGPVAGTVFHWVAFCELPIS